MDTVVLAHKMYEFLGCRSIKTGSCLIAENRSRLEALTPEHVNAPFVFYAVAGWTKFSRIAVEIARRLNDAYDAPVWSHLSMRDWGWIEGGKALLALHENRLPDAESACRFVIQNSDRCSAPPELIATVNFVMARVAKRQGRYAASIQYGLAACESYEAANLQCMIGLTEITISWSLGQLGDSSEEEHRDRAWEYLKGTEDDISLGMIQFSRGRSVSRLGRDLHALAQFDLGAKYLAESRHNLRRLLIDAANIELRRAANEPDAKERKVWSEAATRKLDRVEKHLLDRNDLADRRDRIRLLLARSNEAIRGENRSLRRARQFAKEAFDIGEELRDNLMMSRARYKQAEIELHLAMKEDSDVWRARRIALCYAQEALKLADGLENARLKARIHILMGTIYLERPFHDVALASRHWGEASECMAGRRDVDFLALALNNLQRKLEAEECYGKPDPPICVITTGRAFSQSLEKTLDEVRQQVVLAVQEHEGNVPYAVAQMLDTRRETVQKHLGAAGEQEPATSVDGEIIYRVKRGIAFSQPLQRTLDEVERAVFRAAYIRFGRDKVRARLRLGFPRFTRLCADLQHEPGSVPAGSPL